MGLSWVCSHPRLTSYASGLLISLVTLLVLWLSSAQLRVVGPGQPVTATVGQDVVLRCYLSPRQDARSLEVRWIRDKFSETVHHYCNGEDLYKEQIEAYAGRTELVRDGLSAGSVDLRIMGLRPSDDGRYICIVKDGDASDEATVNLEVSAQLRVVGPDQPVTATVGQDVVLPCHLSPQRDARSLEVRWIRDDLSETVHHYRNGEDLYGEQMGAYAGRTELVRDGLSSGRLDLRITGLRPSDDGQYICTVKNADAYDEATVHLVVSGPFFQNCQTLIVVLLLVLVLLAVSIDLGVCCFRKQATLRLELAGRLAQQAADLDDYRANAESQSARPQELAADLLRKDKELKEQAAELAELKAEQDECRAKAEELAKEREKKDAKLREQAAELAWRMFLLSQNRAKVTLDPCTAHSLLVLSQDNSSVRWQSKWQQVPNNPERFDTRCCVLGREEFREGRHYWEVEVEGEKGKYSSVAVGVARASVKKKGEINMSPEEGIWAVQYNEGQLTSLTSPPTPLSLSPVPTRIWVCLDCTQGQVSFINADNGVEIFIFTDAFLKGESMRPWFWLGTNAQLYLRGSTL